MTDRLGIQPNDRILLLSIPDYTFVRETARLLDRGCLFCLGNRDQVYEARKAARELSNVMFHAGPPEDIPFEDSYFTKVIDLHCDWEDAALVAKEVARTLAGKGRAYLAKADPAFFRQAGLKDGPAIEGFLVFVKPEEPHRQKPPLELPVLR